jgi:hypothetical protein
MATENPPTGPSTSTFEGAPDPTRKSGGGIGRVIKWVVILVLLLVIVGGVVLYMNLNSIVRSTVEKQSAASLNVPTKLEGANVSLFGGDVTLSNFHVGSPEGFVGDMMQLGGIDVGVKVSELREDPLRVNQINISNPKLVIEMKGRDFNIKKFVDQLPAGETRPADNTEPLKLIINNLKVTGAQVVFKPDVQALSSLPGIGQNLGGLKNEYVLTIPPLEMQNIGTGEGNQNGAEIKEIVTALVQQLAAKAAESDQLPPEIRQVLSLNVADIANLAKQKLGEELNKQLDKVSQDLQKKLPGEIGKSLEGVLKDPAGAATNPAKALEDVTKDPGKALQQGLGGLLGDRQKKSPATAPATPPR